MVLRSCTGGRLNTVDIVLLHLPIVSGPSEVQGLLADPIPILAIRLDRIPFSEFGALFLGPVAVSHDITTDEDFERRDHLLVSAKGKPD
jgi:hypothetical protein